MVKDSVNFCQQTHRRSEFPADSNGEFSLESVRTEHLSFWPLLQLLQFFLFWRLITRRGNLAMLRDKKHEVCHDPLPPNRFIYDHRVNEGGIDAPHYALVSISIERGEAHTALSRRSPGAFERYQLCHHERATREDAREQDEGENQAGGR